MQPEKKDTFLYFAGFLISAVAHVTLAIVAILVLEAQKADASKAPEFFTVTLEGGEKLGGINQLPDPDQKDQGNKNTLPAELEEEAPPAEPEPEPETVEEKTKKVEEVEPIQPEEVDKPTAIEEDKKKAEEEAKRLAEEKKKKELEKKKKEEERKKKEKEKKKKEEELRKKKEAEKKRKLEEKRKREEKKRKAREAKERKRKAKLKRDKRLKDAIARAKKRYTGESYDAGGEGFGAAALGGKGMGGGTMASSEFIAYSHALEQHIKSGWRWISGKQRLKAQVLLKILPDGVVRDVQIAMSSGNGQFDDSILRAVHKASPVPAPPSKLYNRFKSVRITFDSHNR